MDSTVACLEAWMPRQRWYGGKARSPRLRVLGSWDLPSADVGAVVRTLLVADDASSPIALYQVPIVARPGPASPEQPHVIGVLPDGTTLVDGPHDGAYADAVLRMLERGGTVSTATVRAEGHPAATASTGADRASAVLEGEQSNTSIIYRPLHPGGTPVICKVYRQVHPGLNPDIELQSALSATGSRHVPPTVGSIDGEWADPADGTRRAGSFAFAQEFLPDVEDAWRVALRAAGGGVDFSVRARALGAATADVHLSLARLFPTPVATDDDRDAVRGSWQRRLRIASAEVPGIADRRAAIEAVYDAAAARPWPPMQRIHGDLHLGQVILVPGRGWVLLDFEGEPMRPMAERLRPDLAPRDVAGMLRSFDYVAGSIGLSDASAADGAHEWARHAREAFLAGYDEVVGTTVRGPLLAALELEKAVYEAIYEARNRPTWVPIPLTAIGRLIDA